MDKKQTLFYRVEDGRYKIDRVGFNLYLSSDEALYVDQATNLRDALDWLRVAEIADDPAYEKPHLKVLIGLVSALLDPHGRNGE